MTVVRGLLTWLSLAQSLTHVIPLPVVDPGLFVISGVMTCGGGDGYCLLGMDCTLDADFLPDPRGHCEGLKNAFTPSAYFTCCKANDMRPSPSYPGTYPPIVDDPTTAKPTPTNASYTQINSTPVSTTPLAETMSGGNTSHSEGGTQGGGTTSVVGNTQTTDPAPTESTESPATREGGDVTEMTSDVTEPSTPEFSYPPLRDNAIDTEDRENSGSRKTGSSVGTGNEATTAKATVSMHQVDPIMTPRMDVFEDTAYMDDESEEQEPGEAPEEQESPLFEQDEDLDNEDEEEEQEMEMVEQPVHRKDQTSEPVKYDTRPLVQQEGTDARPGATRVRLEMNEVRPGGSKGQEILRTQPGSNEVWPGMTRLQPERTEMQPVKTEIRPLAGARPMVTKIQPVSQITQQMSDHRPQMTEMQQVMTKSPPENSKIRPGVTEDREKIDPQPDIVRIRPIMTEVRPETHEPEPEEHELLPDSPQKDLPASDLFDEYAEVNEYDMELITPESPPLIMVQIPSSTQSPMRPSTQPIGAPVAGLKSASSVNSQHSESSNRPIISAGHPSSIGAPTKSGEHSQAGVQENVGVRPMPPGYPMAPEQELMNGYPLAPGHRVTPPGYPADSGHGVTLAYPDTRGELLTPGDLATAEYPIFGGPSPSPSPSVTPGYVAESSTEDLAVSKTYLNYIRDKINTTIAEISTSLNNRFPGLRPGIISNTISDVVAGGAATQRPGLAQWEPPVLADGSSAGSASGLGSGSSELFNRDNASADAFSRPRNCDMVRDVQWRFQEDGQTMCYGVLIDAIRILTSASCVLKLFESNMAGVSAISNRGNNHSIGGVTVHENFQAVSNPQAMNKNDLGIVTLKATVPYGDQCIPKLPFKGQILRNMKCSSTQEDDSEYKSNPALSRYSSNYLNRDSPLCSHSISTFEVNRTPYLTLACQGAMMADTRKISQDTGGSGVICNGILAGIELSSGLGAKAYTPLSMYVDWINKNIRGQSISQRFRVGYYNFKK